MLYKCYDRLKRKYDFICIFKIVCMYETTGIIYRRALVVFF